MYGALCSEILLLAGKDILTTVRSYRTSPRPLWPIFNNVMYGTVCSEILLLAGKDILTTVLINK
jgi:hypothetical protein